MNLAMAPEIKNGVPFFTSRLLSELGTPHGFSLRYRLDEKGRKVRFNLGFTAEKTPGEAARDRRLFCRALGLGPQRLTTGYQSHTANVQVVEDREVGRGGLDISAAFPETDGLATRVPDTALGVFYADCVPILLADPETLSVGALHAGWRGSAAGIAPKAIETMRRALGARPENIRAAIGPSIGPDAYEVSEDVIEAFDAVIPKGSDAPWKPGPRPGKWMMNLWEANLTLLINAGLEPEHIEIMGLCTAADEELFYSNRRDRGIAGSLGAFIGCAFHSRADSLIPS